MSSVDALAQALTSGRAAAFTYDDKDRLIEVHAIGRSTKDGAVVVRGFQVAGGSSRPLPCWALFRVDGIQTEVTVGDVASLAPRPGYKMGDKQMSEIIAQLEVANDG